MNARPNFFPPGNADTMRIDPADGRKVPVDCAARPFDLYTTMTAGTAAP